MVEPDQTNHLSVEGESTSMGNTSASIELTILMPCLNEAETIGICIKKAWTWLQNHNVQGEIIIADNGSTDGSQQIASDLGARVVNISAKGYGNALSGGIAAAQGQYIIMGDADDSYDFCKLDAFLEKLRDKYDLVMGNRFKGGIKPGAMPALHKYLGNPVLTGIARLLFWNPPCRDFHCGLRGFSKSAVLKMDLRTTGMEFASEMIVKAVLHRMRITEVPTVLSPDGRSRPPHLRSWRDGWRHLRFLLLYSPRWLFLYPGAFLMLIGFIIGVWLFISPRIVGGVTLDIHTLLYAGLSVVIGFQSIIFAVFTKIFAVKEGLLPEDPRLDKLFRYVTLEVGLVIGSALLLTGLAGSVSVLSTWGEHAFGPLQPSETLRLVIPATICITLGFQTILCSFFLSVLGMGRR
jgi:glycosyltransferase involved in cell wall biosynthesis